MEWALTKLSRAFRRGEEGQGLAEYALILGFVAVACVLALTSALGRLSAHIYPACRLYVLGATLMTTMQGGRLPSPALHHLKTPPDRPYSRGLNHGRTTRASTRTPPQYASAHRRWSPAPAQYGTGPVAGRILDGPADLPRAHLRARGFWAGLLCVADRHGGGTRRRAGGGGPGRCEHGQLEDLRQLL